MWNTPTGVGCAGFTQFQFDSLKVWKVLEGATCFITYKCEGVEFQLRCWATKLRTRGCSSLFWISLDGSFLSEVIMEASAGLQSDINSVHVSHLDSTVKYSVTDTFIFWYYSSKTPENWMNFTLKCRYLPTFMCVHVAQPDAIKAAG